MKTKSLLLVSSLCFIALPVQAQTNFWQSINGTIAGRNVNCVVFKTSLLAFAGTSRGVFRSNDGASSWISASTGMIDSATSSLVITATGNLLAGTNRGAYRSTDDGTNWTPIINGLPAIPVKSLIYDIAGNRGFAGTDSGVYRSTDDGVSWMSIRDGMTNTRISCLALDSTYKLFGGTLGGGLFRSTDYGTTWLQANFPFQTLSSLWVNRNGYIYSLPSYRSSDGGNTWFRFGPMNGVSSIAVNPSGDVFADVPWSGSLLDPSGLFHSTNNGDTWSDIGFHYSTFRVIGTNLGTHLFGQTSTATLYHSMNNGITWSIQNSLLISRINVIGLDSQNSIFAGGRNACYRSRDNGRNWIDVSPSLVGYEVVALTVTPNDNLIAGTDGARLFRSTNSGDSWNELSVPFMLYSFILNLSSDSNGIIFVGTYSEGVFRSTNEGDTWTKVNNGLGNLNIRSIVFTPNGRMLAGSDNGLYRSTNRGDSWSRIDAGAISSSVQCVLAPAEGYILAGTYLGGIYRSSDDGATWSQINSGLSNLDVRTLASNSGGRILTGTAGAGVYLSTNEGNQWTNVSGGLDNLDIRSLIVDRNGYLLAGTWGSGVFRGTQSLTSVEEMATSLPPDCNLNQNYPNPFNPITNIKFQIANSGFVSLKVFDLLGREVAKLVNEEMMPGSYTRTLNGSGLASGIYFYHLTARTFSQTKKLVLLR